MKVNFLWARGAEQHHRTERPDVFAYSSSYSEWNADEKWSSQEWKSDELMEDRTGRSVVFAQHTDRFIVENDKMNFLHRSRIRTVVRIQIILTQGEYQVRQRQNQSSKDATKDSDKHSVIWGKCLCLLHCKHLYSW